MKKNTSSQKDQPLIDSYDYLANSASANDCTGLIPSAPQSEEELQAYEEIYHYTAPKLKGTHQESSEIS